MNILKWISRETTFPLDETRKESTEEGIKENGPREEGATILNTLGASEANIDPLIDYLALAFEERHNRRPSTAEMLRDTIKEYGLFDEDSYLQNNPDVAEAKLDPLTHYLRHGFKEGRSIFSARDIGSPRRPNVSMRVDAPEAEYLQTGLTQLFFDLKCGTELAGKEATLVLNFLNPDFESWSKHIELRGGRQEFWLAINTHLLPNGENTILIELKTADQVVAWTGAKKIYVANIGPLAEKVRKSLRHYPTPLILDGLCDSSQYDYSDSSLVPWFDQPHALEHIDALRSRLEIDDTESHLLRQFVNDGFVVIEDMIETPLLEQIGSELDDVVARKVNGYEYGTSQRIQHLHKVYPGIKELWMHPKIMHLLELLFESVPRPCQTLTYIFGSQQDAHQDTVHLTPFPAGYMCGVWVAIDDVQPDSGELEVYRGSHRLPRVYLKDAGCAKVANGDWSEFLQKVVAPYKEMLKSGGFERIVYRPKRGTVLIWHENLMHGGTPRIDKSLSRRSIVSHVFADGALVFYDSTGLVGHMEPRERISRANNS